MLFQATVARKHPVNAYGIFEQLKKVGKLDGFINGTVKKVFLIFLIPPKSLEFKKQQIKLDPFLKDESNVRDIKRMRYTWRQDLAKENVETVRELRGLVHDPERESGEKYAPYLEDFDSRNLYVQNSDKILGIPQYAITLNDYGRDINPTPALTEEDAKSLQKMVKQLREEIEFLRSSQGASTGA